MTKVEELKERMGKKFIPNPLKREHHAKYLDQLIEAVREEEREKIDRFKKAYLDTAVRNDLLISSPKSIRSELILSNYQEALDEILTQPTKET